MQTQSDTATHQLRKRESEMRRQDAADFEAFSTSSLTATARIECSNQVTQASLRPQLDSFPQQTRSLSLRIQRLLFAQWTTIHVIIWTLLSISTVHLFHKVTTELNQPIMPQSITIEMIESRSSNQTTISNQTAIPFIPHSVSQYIMTPNNSMITIESNQGADGGAWSMCTHLERYGPNFDRGMANFIAGILRPRSALEFGCGIGLYINFIERFSTADHKEEHRFFGIEPEPMLKAKVFGQKPFNAQQLVMDIFEVEQQTLDDLGTFDVVLSSEVAEHIDIELHPKMYDVLVAKTEQFLVFGAARKDQGGTGHLEPSMGPMERFIGEFEDRGMVHLPKVSERLRDSCALKWDKGANTFVTAHPRFVAENGGIEVIEERFAGKNAVGDLFPDFVRDIYEPLKSGKTKCS